MQLTVRRPRGESLGIDWTPEAAGKSRCKRLMWMGHNTLVARSKFIDLRDGFRIRTLHAAISERSHDFQSSPLVASRGGAWAFWIH
jgi:hypothetical protein